MNCLRSRTVRSSGPEKLVLRQGTCWRNESLYHITIDTPGRPLMRQMKMPTLLDTSFLRSCLVTNQQIPQSVYKELP